jgi:4-amino-4-deoxy-L-arabinose transferase-like glycosyltransferase
MLRTHDRTAERLTIQSSSVVNEVILTRLILLLALFGGAFMRIWEINAMGYNTDEAVYAGQAAAIAGVPYLKDMFPVFRAHPLLFQFVLSVIYKIQFSDLAGRLLAVVVGMGTVFLTYQLGKTLYGKLPGALAALFLALMPYHVIVSRQMLLDGPMVFFSTLTLYMLARFGKSERPAWLYAAGACMGLTFLSKETGIILFGAIYVFLALASELRVRIWSLIIASVLMVLVIAPFPITLALSSGGSSTGQNYLLWQLFRRPNHDWLFYLTTMPPSVGIWVIVAAVLGLILLWRERSWREKLLLSWIIVPFVFFQIWPVKGFQYLLPMAPALAVLAGRALGKLANNTPVNWLPDVITRLPIQRVTAWLAVVAIAVSVGLSSWNIIQPETSTLFLAGTGGVPGGREAGTWVRENVPINARFLTIGPSMANIFQFYGQHFAYGLAVSPNPLRRNPSYQPINNPDNQIRNSDLQYLVWDSFSASRSPYFSDKLLGYVNKYNGRAVHTESISVTDADGKTVIKPVIIIYEVHP